MGDTRVLQKKIMFLFRKHLVPSLRSFSTTRFAARFNETEAAKIAREDSRKQLNLTHHDESFDNENVYRLSRRKVTPGTEDKIKESLRDIIKCGGILINPWVQKAQVFATVLNTHSVEARKDCCCHWASC